MKRKLLKRLGIAFALTFDLAESLDEELLEKKLPDIRSNKIGEQFWCILGARESYMKAIVAGAWVGFGCSVKNAFSIAEIRSKLLATHKQLTDTLESIADMSDAQMDLCFQLLEHELVHHGQLIRYVYALHHPFPLSWNKRYTV